MLQARSPFMPLNLIDRAVDYKTHDNKHSQRKTTLHTDQAVVLSGSVVIFVYMPLHDACLGYHANCANYFCLTALLHPFSDFFPCFQSSSYLSFFVVIAAA